MENFEEMVRRLDGLATGYTHSQILFTAVRAGVFDFLQEPRTAQDVARAFGWSVRGARMLLDGLVALELVAKEAGWYENRLIANTCLVAESEGYQGNIISHKANGWAAWAQLPAAVKSGQAPASIQEEDTAEERRAYILGMDDLGRHSARDIAKRVDLSPYKRFLDAGGGPGSYSIAFLQRHPEMTAALLDRPDVLPIAREQAAKAGVEDRITFVEGDLVADDLGGPFDLILLSNVVHIFGPEANENLTARCAKALASGGLLIIKDFITDDDRTGPPFSLLFALQMLLHTEAGDTYTESDVRSWTRQAGLRDGGLIELTPQSRLWLAHKD